MKKRIFFLFFVILFVFLAILAVVQNSRVYPVAYGVSFSPDQATWLGLDWRETFHAIVTDLHPPFVRISALWNETEPAKNHFSFADLDWMFAEASRAGVKVTLVVGQKAPRWPECHIPSWFSYSDANATQEFFTYAQAVVDRYRHNPALEIWQVENEPFIHFSFGQCAGYRADWTIPEIALIRAEDLAHKILVTDSGELSTWREASEAGDYFGTTLYRVVRTSKGKIWTYDWLPAIHYYLKARFWGLSPATLFVSELQAEPWLSGENPKDVPLSQQETTMNPARLLANLEYVRHIGASRAYLWGAEWWYWAKTKAGDPRYWNIVRLLNSSH